MSWLHNMSVPPRTTVVLHQAVEAMPSSTRACYNLGHAVRHGLPWPDPAALPRPAASFCNGAKPLAPWLLVALLALAETPADGLIQITRAPRHVSAETAVAALEVARRNRNLHGALLVRPVQAPKASTLQTDLVMTLLLLAQSTDRVFVAVKQPVLDRLHPRLSLEVLTPMTVGEGVG